MQGARRWQALHYGDCHLRQWEDETFLFNPRSGNTHLLNAAAAELLHMLAEGPLGMDAMLARLYAPDLGIDRDAFATLLREHLDQLSLIGLVRST